MSRLLRHNGSIEEAGEFSLRSNSPVSITDQLWLSINFETNFVSFFAIFDDFSTMDPLRRQVNSALLTRFIKSPAIH